MAGWFRDRVTSEIYDGHDKSARARRRLPLHLWALAQLKLDRVLAAESLDDLRSPPANNLKALKGERAGQYSIRINAQYRICFEWTDSGAVSVEVVDYH